MIDRKTDQLAVVLAGIDVVIVAIIAGFPRIDAAVATGDDEITGLIAAVAPITCFHALLDETIATLGDLTVGKASIFIAAITVITGFEAFLALIEVGPGHTIAAASLHTVV